MSNPYSSPGSRPTYPPNYMTAQTPPTHLVAAPSIALMTIAIVSLVVFALAVLFNLFLMVTGTVDQLEQFNPGIMSPQAKVISRMVFGCILVCVSAFVLYGAIQMKQLKNYGVAKAASIVAMIPCLSPCYLLGIPFGIWTIVVLSKPEVRNAFKS